MKRLALTAVATAAFLSGCLQDKVAGGSSEVDNPIVVAFVDSGGASVSTTGSLSIYLAGQNPAVDPDPLLTKQFDHVSSIELSARDFTQGLDSTRSYNLLLIGDDSVGALVQNLSYQPGNGRYTLDSVRVVKVKVPVVPLVRYEASLDAPSDSGVVRVFIPGSPFQSVVVDSSFVINGVPAGTFPLRVLSGNGQERALKPAPDNPGPGNHHQIDSSSPPIVRPPPFPPAQSLSVFAGYDAGLLAASGGGSTPFSLFGSVQGADPQDPRLAVVWKQIFPNAQGAKAVLESPTSLNTRVSFPRPGAYQFVLSAALGNDQRVEDTVLIGIQAPQEQTVFIAPTAGDTVYLGTQGSPLFKVVWNGQKKDSLLLDISRDGGSTWSPVPMPVLTLDSKPGVNSFDWNPQGDSSGNARLRLRKSNSEVVATTQTFQLRYRPAPPAKKS